MKRKMLSIYFLCLSLVLWAMPLSAQAGADLGHGCFDLDGNLWCDLCDEPMEHDCFSTDGNARCDLCDEVIVHTCHDQDGNGSCDVCTRPCENTGFLPGDVTGEGVVNMGDVSMLYAHVRGTGVLTDPKVLARCDITGEGRINMADVSGLYAHIRGTRKLN